MVFFQATARPTDSAARLFIDFVEVRLSRFPNA